MCTLADRKAVYSKAEKKSVSKLWTTVELSLPIILPSDDDHIWRIRVIFQNVQKRIYLDIRQFKIVRTEHREEYQITENGLFFSILEWIQILNPLIKLLNKFKDDK